MNLQEVLIDSAEVVVIGLTGRYDPALRDYESADSYDVQSFDSTYQAFRYLQARIADPGAGAVEAVVCDVKTLAREGYLFVHNIRRDLHHCDVPIIGIDRTGKFASPEVLVQGVDDCYVAPVGWDILRERISQIREFRAMMRADVGLDAQTADSAYEIPRGKRVFDIVFALGALAFWGIPMLLIALTIRIGSKGPILYRSKRIGTGYEEFEFLKFRSMVVDADTKVAELQASNNYGADAAFFKMKNDPRVTAIGRLIRNTSLDELPQLLNVLYGDMSVVGNRPLPLREAETLTSEEWSERFLAPAGITGMWQTSGSGKDTMRTEDRMALDIEYAREYSPLTDLKILFKTFGAMKQDSNV